MSNVQVERGARKGRRNKGENNDKRMKPISMLVKLENTKDKFDV